MSSPEKAKLCRDLDPHRRQLLLRRRRRFIRAMLARAGPRETDGRAVFHRQRPHGPHGRQLRPQLPPCLGPQGARSTVMFLIISKYEGTRLGRQDVMPIFEGVARRIPGQ
jgi:hypothetical protein